MAFFDFLGFSFKNKGVQEEKELLSPVPPQLDDESTIITTGGGFMNTSYNLDFNSSNKKILIEKYRELSLHSEIESAIDEIINEAIVTGEAESPVAVILDKLPFSEEIKEVITQEFENILTLLDFNENAYEIFKRWYVDGRIFFSVVIDAKNTKDGIQELRYIDPREIEKIKEVKEELSKRGVKLQKTVQEYYIYKDVKLPADSVASSNSGLIDYRNKSIVISYLHKAIKPYNQLRMLEDATVIYRLARAPERRVFKIGTGGLPKIKAEQYVNGLMNKFRGKLVYDSATGDLKDDARSLSILEDFWIPVGEDGKTTDISTLPGGCLAMNTEVPLLDGRVLTLNELTDEYKSGKENWTYSCHPTTGEIVPGLISWAGVTQESAKVMKLTFDNGKELICTPDHKFPIFDVGFVEAKDLTVGQSMIPTTKTVDNISISRIEYLDEKIQVGTLTIDSDEKLHNYHTFALAVGIFTKNSNLGEMGDVEYFRKKLYRALHVPITRITEGSSFNTGRSAEIDREEVKFNKFIKRLRLRFSALFTDLLRSQLILKNIVTPEEWDLHIKNRLFYDFRKDSHFAEYNEAEIQSRRMELASTAIGLGDEYFSPAYIKKYFLKLSDEEIKDMEIDAEEVPEEPTPEESDLGFEEPDFGMGSELPTTSPQEPTLPTSPVV
jgi:hypothetical protein